MTSFTDSRPWIESNTEIDFGTDWLLPTSEAMAMRVTRTYASATAILTLTPWPAMTKDELRRTKLKQVFHLLSMTCQSYFCQCPIR